jgi:hypothetical protein
MEHTPEGKLQLSHELQEMVAGERADRARWGQGETSQSEQEWRKQRRREWRVEQSVNNLHEDW